MEDFADEVLPPVLIIGLAWVLLALCGDEPQHMEANHAADTTGLRAVQSDSLKHKPKVVFVHVEL